MSTDAKHRLEVIGLLISLAVGLAAFGKSWFTLPYRLDQAEVAIAAARTDRELLVRIDERLRQVQDDVQEVKRQQPAAASIR
jgi:hypothetical protein